VVAVIAGLVVGRGASFMGLIIPLLLVTLLQLLLEAGAMVALAVEAELQGLPQLFTRLLLVVVVMVLVTPVLVELVGQVAVDVQLITKG